MNEATAFKAPDSAPGQPESRTAFSRLKNDAKAKEQSWWTEFEELLDQGWDWRRAAFIAWLASPIKDRWPEHQEELAVEVLGLRHDTVLWRWRRDNPQIDRTVAKLQAAPLLRHRRDIYEALVTSATDPDPRSHPDRRMALEMLGDYTPRSKVQAEVDIDAEIGLMTVDEWREERSRRQAEIAETMAAFEDATVDGTSAVPG